MDRDRMAAVNYILGVCLILVVTCSSQPVPQSEECPGGWLYGGYYCYKVLSVEEDISWFGARVECEKLGGFLAEPTTSQISDFLVDLALYGLELNGINQFHLGLTDLAVEGKWMCPYVDSAPDAFFWGPDYPNTAPGNSDDCAVLVLDESGSYWADVNCETKATVAPICQIESYVTTGTPSTGSTPTSNPTTTTQGPTTSATTAGPPTATTTTPEEGTSTTTGTTPTGSSTSTTSQSGGSCQDGWVGFGDNCYLLSSGLSDWTSGQAECGSAGGQLASIHSQEENDFINNLADSLKWIGGKYVDHQLSWIDGTEVDFVNWHSSEPSGSLEFVLMRSDGTWFNRDNGLQYSYVCKI